MRTLTARLAPHARRSWLTFGAVMALVLAAAIVLVLLGGGGRVGVVMTAFVGLVMVVVLGAILDAILVPGNPDVRRHAGHDAGWTGLGAVAGFDAHGGHGGGHGGGHSGDGGSSG